MEKQTPNINSTVEQFQSGSSCAQSVLAAYLPSLGIPVDLAHKMGAGLGGGIGGKQYVCGALNAGVMVLSTHLGNSDQSDTEKKQIATDYSRQFVERFEEKFGSAQCRDLLGEDTSTVAGKERAAAADVYRKVCDQCVAHVCQGLDEFLGPDGVVES